MKVTDYSLTVLVRDISCNHLILLKNDGGGGGN